MSACQCRQSCQSPHPTFRDSIWLGPISGLPPGSLFDHMCVFHVTAEVFRQWYKTDNASDSCVSLSLEPLKAWEKMSSVLRFYLMGTQNIRWYFSKLNEFFWCTRGVTLRKFAVLNLYSNIETSAVSKWIRDVNLSETTVVSKWIRRVNFFLL